MTSKEVDSTSALIAFVDVAGARGRFNCFWWYLFAGHTIFAVDPLPEINQLTALGTEWTERIVFPLDRITAGWTLWHRPQRYGRDFALDE